MKRKLQLFRLFAFMFGMMLSYQATSQCYYTLKMYDSWGDGWNGNELEVTYGTNVDTVTLPSTLGDSMDYVLIVNTGDTINLNYLGGGLFNNEVSFVLQDYYGTVLYSSGQGPSVGYHYGTTATCPSCAGVVNPSATILSATSANLSWTEVGPATQWQVEWGLSGFTQGNGTVVLTNNNPHLLTGLSASTTYDYYVRSICAPGDTSIWNGPATFTTPCPAYNLPFSESFDGIAPSLPGCWSTNDTNIVTTSSSCTGSINESLQLFGAAGVYAETPLINAGGVSSLIVYYKYRAGANSDCGNTPESADSVAVEYWDSTSWVLLKTYNGSQPNVFTDDTITISTGLTNSFKLRFRIISGSGPSFDNWNFDSLEIVQAPCTTPDSLYVTNLTSNSADLNWNEPGSATQWELEWGMAGFAQGSGNMMVTSNNPYSLSGLTPNTTYEYYVRSICSAGDTSAWYGPLAFSTMCNDTSNTMTVVACDSYTWINGITYTSTTMAYDTLTNMYGCDSVMILDLTINNSVSDSMDITACDSYIWDGITYTSSTTIIDSLSTSTGCDSIVTINLTIYNSTSDTTTVDACGSYTWNGTTYTSSTVVVDSLISSSGCDSVVVLDLTINTVDTSVTVSNDTILMANAIGASYQWLDCNQGYAPIPGETSQTFMPTANGEYAVEVTENGCTDTSMCYTIVKVGIEDAPELYEVNIFPNPSEGLVNIQLGNMDNVQVRVYTISGQVIYQDYFRRTNLITFQMDQTPGVYIVEVIGSSGVVSIHKLSIR